MKVIPQPIGEWRPRLLWWKFGAVLITDPYPMFVIGFGIIALEVHLTTWPVDHGMCFDFDVFISTPLGHAGVSLEVYPEVED